MSKTEPTPKQLFRRRLRNNKLIKVAPLECDSKLRKPITIKHKKFEPHLRKLDKNDFPNPFKLPEFMRIFSKKLAPRKIHPEPAMTEDVHTVCDIHKEFYKTIEGRPLRQAGDIKVYISNIRDIFLFRTNAGFLKEEMIRIDTDFRTEIEEYEKIEKLYKQYSASFVELLKISFIQAKKAQERADEVVVKIEKKNDELEEYTYQYSKLKIDLVILSARYEVLLKYSEFLNSLAPHWLHQQGINKHRETRIQTRLSSTIELGPRIAIKSALSLPSDEPLLVFHKPKELMIIFNNICRQGHLYMEFVNYTNEILKAVRKDRDDLKAQLKKASDGLEAKVEMFRNRITYLEEKAMGYKSAFDNLLLNSFQRLYGDTVNIKLHTCVQYVHTRIFGDPEDKKDNVVTLMYNIEQLYMDISLDMDYLDVSVVNAAAKEMFAKDIKMISQAYKAQRELRECDILSKTLYISYEPPRKAKNNR